MTTPWQRPPSVSTRLNCHQRGPWRNLDHTTFATLEYIDWYNHRRLHGGITPNNTYTTPADHETNYHQTTPRKPVTTQTTHSP